MGGRNHTSLPAARLEVLGVGFRGRVLIKL